jgi:hypothetical protein
MCVLDPQQSYTFSKIFELKYRVPDDLDPLMRILVQALIA